MFSVIVALAVLAAGCLSNKSSSSSTTTTTSSGNSNANSVVGSGTFDNGSPAKGGNHRIGWESSFGFTNLRPDR